MNVYEFKAVKIDGNSYDIDVHDLHRTMDITDHNDDYCFGESAQVITDFDFGTVVIHVFDNQIDIDCNHSEYDKIKEQIKIHIFDDHEFMAEWQDREFAE